MVIKKHKALRQRIDNIAILKGEKNIFIGKIINETNYLTFERKLRILYKFVANVAQTS